MKCPNCGAKIIGDQTFCTSCGAKIFRGNHHYDLKLKNPTSYIKAIDLTSKLTGFSTKKSKRLLHNSHPIIKENVSLNEAAKIKSMFIRLGIDAEIATAVESFQNDKNKSLDKKDSFIEEEDLKASDSKPKDIERSPKNEIEKKTVEKKIEIPKKKIVKKNTLGSNLIIYTFVIIIILFIYLIYYISNINNVKDKLPLYNSKKTFKKKLQPQKANKKISKKRLQSKEVKPHEIKSKKIKSKKEGHTSRFDNDKKYVESIFANQKNDRGSNFKSRYKTKKEGNTKTQSGNKSNRNSTQNSLKNRTSFHKDIIKNSSAGLSKKGFLVNIPMKKDLPVIVEITKPDKNVIIKNTVIKSGVIYIKADDKIDKLGKGSYQISVYAKNISTIDGLLSKDLSHSSKGYVIFKDKLIFEKDIDFSKLLDTQESVKLLYSLLGESFDKKNFNSQYDDDNIYIKGTVKNYDIKNFIYKTCAGIGFCMKNSKSKQKNLFITVNNLKFKIVINKCVAAMIAVDNNFRLDKFKDIIDAAIIRISLKL